MFTSITIFFEFPHLPKANVYVIFSNSYNLKLGEIIFPPKTLMVPTLNKGIVNPLYNHAFNDLFFVTLMNCGLNVYSHKANPSLGGIINNRLQ